MRNSLFIISIFLACACGSRVVQYVNERSNFKNYETYILLNFKAENKQISPEGTELIRVLEDAIKGEMEKREYSINSKSPDLLLRYELVANSNTRTNRNNTGFGFQRISSSTFLESVILLEMTDYKTKKLVWSGSIDMRDQSRRNKSTRKEDNLISSIQKIFSTYLYKSGSSEPDPTLVKSK